jgi:hypothetical protein
MTDHSGNMNGGKTSLRELAPDIDRDVKPGGDLWASEAKYGVCSDRQCFGWLYPANAVIL